MVTEQTAEAMKLALRSAAGPGANAAGPGAGGPGRRLLAAMIGARESGCKCGSCVLLREELDVSVGAFLKMAVEAATPAGEVPPGPEAAVTPLAEEVAMPAAVTAVPAPAPTPEAL